MKWQTRANALRQRTRTKQGESRLRLFEQKRPLRATPPERNMNDGRQMPWGPRAPTAPDERFAGAVEFNKITGVKPRDNHGQWL